MKYMTFDWTDIRLLRTADGIYIFDGPSNENPEPEPQPEPAPEPAPEPEPEPAPS